MKRIFKTSALYISAEVITKIVQSIVVLGFAAVSTKSQYAEFGLVLALHLLAYAVVFGGAAEALAAARSRALEISPTLLFVPAFYVAGIFSAIAILLFVIIGTWYVAKTNSGISQLAIIASVVSGSAIGFVRYVSTVMQIDGRHHVAILFRVAQSMVGYLLGIAAIAIYKADPVSSFFCGYALGVGIVCFIFIAVTPRFNSADDYKNTKLLLNDTTTYLLPAIFGWLFGYGFSWLVEYSGRSHDDVAEFTMALSVSFICPLIMNSVYTTWNPSYVSAQRDSTELREKWFSLNSDIWYLPLIIVCGFGVVTILSWDTIVRMAGSRLLSYQHLELSISFIMIGHLLLSFYYVTVPIFVTEGAGKLFARITLLGNVVGIFAAIFALLSSTLNIAFGYALALMLRGLIIALVAKNRWHVPLPIGPVLVSTVLLLLTFVAIDINSLAIKISALAAISAFTAIYALRARNAISR